MSYYKEHKDHDCRISLKFENERRNMKTKKARDASLKLMTEKNENILVGGGADRGVGRGWGV